MMKIYTLAILAIFLIMGCSTNDTKTDWLNTLFDDEVDAGTYTILWDQTDSDGNQLLTSEYEIHLNTNDYHGSVRIYIGNYADSSKVVFKPTPDVIPTSFAIRTDSEYYEAGDTITIEIDLPTFCRAIVRVKQGGEIPGSVL